MFTSTDRHQLTQSSDVLSPPISSPVLQRKCACGRHGEAAGGVPPMVHDVIREAGRPLDPDARAMMESQFGQDFSFVRVHTGARAEASARAVHASAYTLGRDVVFGKGRYAPHDSGGQKLLAHELAHVVQQGGVDARGRLNPSLRFGDAGDERFADRAADEVARGDRVSESGRAPAGVMLQRQEETGTTPEAAPMPAIGETAPQGERMTDGDPSECRSDHDRLPLRDRPFRAESGNGYLPIFCVTQRRLQLTIRGDWREQISDPNDRPGDQRNRRPDRPKFYLSLAGWWTGGTHLTTADITPGTERTFTFEDVDTGREGLGYRVHINCIDPQRNRVLHGHYSVSQS